MITSFRNVFSGIKRTKTKTPASIDISRAEQILKASNEYAQYQKYLETGDLGLALSHAAEACQAINLNLSGFPGVSGASAKMTDLTSRYLKFKKYFKQGASQDRSLMEREHASLSSLAIPLRKVFDGYYPAAQALLTTINRKSASDGEKTFGNALNSAIKACRAFTEQSDFDSLDNALGKLLRPNPMPNLADQIYLSNDEVVNSPSQNDASDIRTGSNARILRDTADPLADPAQPNYMNTDERDKPEVVYLNAQGTSNAPAPSRTSDIQKGPTLGNDMNTDEPDNPEVVYLNAQGTPNSPDRTTASDVQSGSETGSHAAPGDATAETPPGSEPGRLAQRGQLKKSLARSMPLISKAKKVIAGLERAIEMQDGLDETQLKALEDLQASLLVPCMSFKETTETLKRLEQLGKDEDAQKVLEQLILQAGAICAVVPDPDKMLPLARHDEATDPSSPLAFGQDSEDVSRGDGIAANEPANAEPKAEAAPPQSEFPINYADLSAANPSLYFQANRDGSMKFRVDSRHPGDPWQKVEQFCAYLAVQWLTQGGPASGLRFDGLPNPDGAVATVRNWAGKGGASGQVAYASARIGGQALAANQVLVKAGAGQLGPGTLLWFGNDRHALATIVCETGDFRVYDPNTGATEVLSPEQFAANPRNANVFVVKPAPSASLEQEMPGAEPSASTATPAASMAQDTPVPGSILTLAALIASIKELQAEAAGLLHPAIAKKLSKAAAALLGDLGRVGDREQLKDIAQAHERLKGDVVDGRKAGALGQELERLQPLAKSHSDPNLQRWFDTARKKYDVGDLAECAAFIQLAKNALKHSPYRADDAMRERMDKALSKYGSLADLYDAAKSDLESWISRQDKDHSEAPKIKKLLAKTAKSGLKAHIRDIERELPGPKRTAKIEKAILIVQSYIQTFDADDEVGHSRFVRNYRGALQYLHESLSKFHGGVPGA